MGIPVEFASFEAPEGADERTRLATEAWSAVTRLFLSQQDRRDEVAEKLGLHASDLISLFHMQPDEGVSQRALAEHWSCDPSWVTNRIDRLEQLGFVERRLSPGDRRVKEVWLTAAGLAKRTQGIAGFGRPPDHLQGLSTTDLRVLAKVLAKLVLPDPMRLALHNPGHHG